MTQSEAGGPPGPDVDHRTTIFIHIPKTAGMSLRETVERVYPGDRCVFIYSHNPAHLDAVRKDVQRADPV